MNDLAKEAMRLATMGSQGEACVLRYLRPDGSPIETVQDVAETLAFNALSARGALCELHGVGEQEGDVETRTICTTGNGELSAQNAEVIAFLMRNRRLLIGMGLIGPEKIQALVGIAHAAQALLALCDVSPVMADGSPDLATKNATDELNAAMDLLTESEDIHEELQLVTARLAWAAGFSDTI